MPGGWVVRAGNAESVCIANSPRDQAGTDLLVDTMVLEDPSTVFNSPEVNTEKPLSPTLSSTQNTNVNPSEPTKKEETQTKEKGVQINETQKLLKTPKKRSTKESENTSNKQRGDNENIPGEKRTTSCPMLTIHKQSLSDVVESHPPKENRKVDEVFDELITTERSYLENLRVIVEIFVRPLREKGILNKVQLSNIFSNVETLYEQVNVELMKRLETIECSENKIEETGQLFIEFAPLFKLYAVYCSNQPNIHSRIQQFKESSEEFTTFLKRAQKVDVCRKLDIESFLITPLQRLCKYPLLLRELIKNTLPGGKAFMLLSQAQESIGEIVTKVNERVRKIENINKLIEVNQRITFSPSCPFDILSDHNRIFKLDETFQLNFKDVHGYLFNDVFMIAHQNKDDVFEVDKIIWCHGCVVRNIVSVGKKIKHELELIESGDEIGSVMSFSTKFKKKKWLKTLHSVFSEAPTPPDGIETPRFKLRLSNSTSSLAVSRKERRHSSIRHRSLRKGVNIQTLAQRFEAVAPEPEKKSRRSKTEQDYKKLYEKEHNLRLEIEKSYQAKIRELEDIVHTLQLENNVLKEKLRHE